MTDRDKFFWAIGIHGSDTIKVAIRLDVLGVPRETITKDLERYYEIITEEITKAAERTTS